MKNLERSPHLSTKTFLVWMWERSVNKNPDWCLEGLTFLVTDEDGNREHFNITTPFELKFEDDRMYVLYLPQFTEDQIKPHVKKKIMERYEHLNSEY